MLLADYLGQDIIVLIPRMSPELRRVKLIGVEAGGIWIESQPLTNALLAQVGYAATPRNLGFFFPYSQIAEVVASEKGLSLDETAFGL